MITGNKEMFVRTIARTFPGIPKIATAWKIVQLNQLITDMFHITPHLNKRKLSTVNT